MRMRRSGHTNRSSVYMNARNLHNQTPPMKYIAINLNRGAMQIQATKSTSHQEWSGIQPIGEPPAAQHISI